MSNFGVPSKFGEDSLPTELDVYHHFLLIRDGKIASGEWNKFTSMQIKLKVLLGDVYSLWDRTGIPHCMSSREGERRLSNLINKCKNLSKVPLSRRDRGHANDLQILFDVALCTHTDALTCTCPPAAQVWHDIILS